MENADAAIRAIQVREERHTPQIVIDGRLAPGVSEEVAFGGTQNSNKLVADGVNLNDPRGGEPLVNFPVVQHVIRYAKEKNQTIGKNLEFTMVTNMSLMDDSKLEFLLENKVQLCTSIDGPEHLHDKQRKLPGLSAHKAATGWIGKVNQAYVDMGLDPMLYHVEALLTTTRETLPRWKEVVDTYVALGCRSLFLRPVDPFGFMDRTGPRIEYPRTEYMDFYRKSVDYIIELNAQGVQIMERYAAIFLTKMLRGEDPNFLDIRSPGGQGLGVLAYNYDGRIFTCDEGRMLAREGDETFRLGHVRDARYRALMAHPTVRAMLVASNLDAQPACTACAYRPYCGVCPVHNHKTQRSLAGRTRESSLCAAYMGIQDFLFETLARADGPTRAVLERWTSIPPRERFVHRAPR